MDYTQIITTVITALGTLGGSLAGIVISNTMVNYRLTQLEKSVEKLAAIEARVTKLETIMTITAKE